MTVVTESGSATFSEDRFYRYHLSRRWGNQGTPLLWVMLNPSTAGAFDDDPTIRRCIGFTRREGFAGIEVVNLFGLVATDPKGLRGELDPVGPRNRAWVDISLAKADAVVVAWGATIDKVPQARSERAYVLARAVYHDTKVMDLGTTKDGHPRHPLYLAADTPLRVV